MLKGGKKSLKFKEVILDLIEQVKETSGKVLVPRVLRHFDHSVDHTLRRSYVRSYTNATIARLHNQKLITFVKRDGHSVIRLTKVGQEHLSRYRLGSLKIKKTWRWDGKWRIITFDIKETKRLVRDRFRRELEVLGFARLQNSVWVYPYECREVATLMKAGYKIGKEIIYVVAESIENDIWLRKHFGFPV